MRRLIRIGGLLAAAPLAALAAGCGGSGGGGDGDPEVLFTETFDLGPGNPNPSDAWRQTGLMSVDAGIGVPGPSIRAGSSTQTGELETTRSFPTDRGISMKVEVRPAPGAFV